MFRWVLLSDSPRPNSAAGGRRRFIRNTFSSMMTSIVYMIGYLFIIRILFHGYYLVSHTQFDPDEYWQNLEPAYCIVFAQVDSNTFRNHNLSRAFHHDGQQPRHKRPNCVYTWEWTRRRSSSLPHVSQSSNLWMHIISRFKDALHGPVRSHMSLLPTIFIYTLCKRFQWDSRNMIATYGPYFIHGITVVIPTDVAMSILATTCERMFIDLYSTSDSRTLPSRTVSTSTVHNWTLFASLTNWFLAYTLTRTYSNSIECMLLTVGVALILSALYELSSIIHDIDLEEDTIKSTISSTNTTASARIIPMKYWYQDFALSILCKIAFAFFLGGFSVAIRFSSIATWIPLGLITTIRISHTTILSSSSHNLRMIHRTLFQWYPFCKAIGFCAFFGILGLLLSCLVDRYYYGFWAIPFLGNFHFNIILGYGSLYGTHSISWYFLVGLPCVCGFLLPFFLSEVYFVCDIILKRILRQDFKLHSMIEDPYFILVVLISSHLCFHSISPHKELRFILTILPLMCVLAGRALTRFELRGNSVQSERTKLTKLFFSRQRFLIVSSLIMNYPHLYYLCRFHQPASIDVNKYISTYILQEHAERQNLSLTQLKASTKQYQVHYLLGCHSTPLYSHLHIRPSNMKDQITINTWTLDCSPDCRSDPDRICESDAFLSNPLQFIDEYCNLKDASSSRCADEGDSIDITVCDNFTSSPRNCPFRNCYLPDVIVIEGDAYDRLRNLISSIDFKEMEFRQGIQSIRILLNNSERNATKNSKFCFRLVCINIGFKSIWVLTRSSEEI